MANTYTTRLNLTKPEVGADTNAWGGHLNANFDTIDSNMVSLSVGTTQTLVGNIAISNSYPAISLIDTDYSNKRYDLLNNTGGCGVWDVSASRWAYLCDASGNFFITGNASAVNATFTGTLSVTGSATFSSTLTASVAPTLGGHLTNKTYVDAQNALKLSLAGGTMTGAITLAGNPSGALDAAPKQYVDSVKSTIDAYTITAGSGLSGGGAINGSPTLSIPSGGVTPAKLSQPFTSATAQTANAVNIDFTGIPSWVKRITVSFSSVATSTGTSTYPLIQIGSSAGFETTGYLSASIEIGLGGRQFTSGFGINSGSVNAFSGHIVFTNVTGNTWAISGTTIRYSDTTGHISTGTKTLSGTIDRLRVTTSNSAAYSSGTINVFYE